MILLRPVVDKLNDLPTDMV